MSEKLQWTAASFALAALSPNFMPYYTKRFKLSKYNFTKYNIFNSVYTRGR